MGRTIMRAGTEPHMKRTLSGSIAILVLAFASLGAQQGPQPTCRNCPATYMPQEEIQTYLTRAVATNTTHQQVRAADIGKSHVAIGLVHRPKITAPGEVAEHDLVTEVYHVISGSATLVTGPELVGAER